MSMLSYISATSTTPPVPQESSSLRSVQNNRPTKVVLPKKKPVKWSTGIAPGEYGGPPTTTKLRKYWGGEKEDPLESDEFIWNNDFMGRMKRLIQDPEQSSIEAVQSKEESSGFLSLKRAMSLDSLEVDLSKELSASSIPLEKPLIPAAERHGRMSKKWKLVPTRREQDKWDKATKATTGGTDVILRELNQPRGDPAVLAAKSREQYFKLKNKLQVLTLGIGGVGLVSAYVSYSPEIAASFGVGLAGSLAYMRMLGNSVDSIADGAAGAKKIVKGAVGQPRLLVPVVLVMIFNRWNAIVVPEYGFMQLELIPMLVGFFTYKIATFVQAIEDTFFVLGKRSQV